MPLQISYEQLQRVDPAFSRITQGQLNILVKALNTLPAASWDALIKMVQGLGPVTDVVVAAHQMTGQLPTTPGNSPGESNAVIQWKPIKSLINMNANANANAQKSVQGGSRKMLQTAAEEDAAAAALAAAAMSIASQEASAAPAAPAPAGPPPVGYCKTSDEVQAAVSDRGAYTVSHFMIEIEFVVHGTAFVSFSCSLPPPVGYCKTSDEVQAAVSNSGTCTLP